MTRIAFIGLGNMGGPMAANLARSGHEVIGFDLAQASCEEAKAQGVAIAGAATDAVRDADAVVTMLPAGRHVRSVWAEIAPAMKRDALLIDSSTIDVDSARAVHALAGEAGLMSIDAPVSGGTGGAKAATLTFMVGGTDAAFGAARLGMLAAGAGSEAEICAKPAIRHQIMPDQSGRPYLEARRTRMQALYSGGGKRRRI